MTPVAGPRNPNDSHGCSKSLVCSWMKLAMSCVKFPQAPFARVTCGECRKRRRLLSRVFKHAFPWESPGPAATETQDGRTRDFHESTEKNTFRARNSGAPESTTKIPPKHQNNIKCQKRPFGAFRLQPPLPPPPGLLWFLWESEYQFSWGSLRAASEPGSWAAAWSNSRNCWASSWRDMLLLLLFFACARAHTSNVHRATLTLQREANVETTTHIPHPPLPIWKWYFRGGGARIVRA